MSVVAALSGEPGKQIVVTFSRRMAGLVRQLMKIPALRKHCGVISHCENIGLYRLRNAAVIGKAWGR
jgi:hypothetical protein